MGRGQYDRSAVRKPDAPQINYYDPNQDMVVPLTQSTFDAIQASARKVAEERDRLRRLCQTHGLWIDG